MVFNEVWVRASFFCYPILYKVFLLILAVLWSGWFWIFLWSPVQQVSLLGYGVLLQGTGSFYNYYHCHFMFPYFFSSPTRSCFFCGFFIFFNFYSGVFWTAESTNRKDFFFLSRELKLSRLLTEIGWSVGNSKNFALSIFLDRFKFAHILPCIALHLLAGFIHIFF